MHFVTLNNSILHITFLISQKLAYFSIVYYLKSILLNILLFFLIVARIFFNTFVIKFNITMNTLIFL